MNILDASITFIYENIISLLIAAYLLSIIFINLCNRKSFIKSFILIVLSFIFFYLLPNIFSLLGNFNSDSYLELINHDTIEAFEWIKNYSYTLIHNPFGNLKSLVLYYLLIFIFALLFIPIIFALNKYLSLPAKGNAIIISSLITVSIAFAIFNGFSAQQEMNSFFEPPPNKFIAPDDKINLFVYIGESTTSMNLSIYGYPFNTTPLLNEIYANDPGLLKFNNVRSTHTHTSASLIRALSIPGINSGKRVSTFSIIDSLGIPIKYVSAQPKDGSMGLAARYLFHEIQPHGSIHSHKKSEEAKDHLILDSVINETGVIFFHSYAGHSPYLKNIDLSLSNYHTLPEIEFQGIFGSNFYNLPIYDLNQKVMDYDRALSYIDHNVSSAIKSVKIKKDPSILIYFSDHGESVYTNRGHNSAQYIEEMSRIPLLIYFNQSYIEKFPETHKKYIAASMSDKVILADQISPSIIELLQIKSDITIPVPTVSSSSSHPHPFIMERSKDDLGIKILNTTSSIKWDPRFQSTSFAQLTFHTEIEPTICYHRSNSFAKALRGSIVAKCLEIDLVINNNSLSIHHPPKESTNFSLNHIFQITESKNTSLWIDAKNISFDNCKYLYNTLQRNRSRSSKILVEFDDEIFHNLANINDCVKSLNAIDISTSFHIPASILNGCDIHATTCKELDQLLNNLKLHSSFTNISFDNKYELLFLNSSYAASFLWNTWGIDGKNFYKIKKNRYNFIILDAYDDPNNY